MQLMRFMGAVLVTTAWISLDHSTARADATAWSAAASACVPANVTTGLAAYGPYVYVYGGATVTLHCGITRAALPGAFDTIEISYNAGNWPTTGREGDAILSELVEVEKATSQAKIKCAVQPKLIPGGWRTARNLCNNSEVDFNKNFYYVRIVVRDNPMETANGLFVGGIFLISTR